MGATSKTRWHQMLMATGKDQALLACSSTVAHSSHRADEQVGEEERRGGKVECLEAQADLHARRLRRTCMQPRTEAEPEEDLHATGTCWWPVAGGRRALAVRGDEPPTPAYVAAGACRVEEVDGGGGGPRVTRVWGRQWEVFVGWGENIGLGLLEWLDEWKFGFFYLNSGTGVLNPNYP